MAIPKRVADRLHASMKQYRPIIEQQRTRDVSEADTVTLVKDLLADLFGYDKYAELTGEFAIRGTYCDLAIKLDGKLSILIEVKAIGSALDDRHVKQATDYAANQGVEWVVLTNGIEWRIYEMIFAQPIDKRLILTIDILNTDVRKDEGRDALYVLTREGFVKGAHIELRDRQDATSRYLIAALLLKNTNVAGTIRRELRRVVDVMVDEGDILKVMQEEVIKRDTLEGPAADAAIRRVSKHGEKALRKSKSNSSESRDAAVADSPTGSVP